jgi:hypothetical protein
VKYLIIPFLVLIAFSSNADGYELFEDHGLVGMKNEQGQIVIPAAFESLGWSDGSFSVIGQTTGYRLNHKWGLINLKKEFITTADFEELIYKSGEYVVARKRVSPVAIKSGCINLRGEVKLPFMYDGIEINGLRAIVFNLVGAKFNYGLTDLQNQVLIPLSFATVFSLGTLRYAVENSTGKIAMFSEAGKPVTEFRIDSLSKFYKGYSILYENGLQGLIDREGEIKMPTHYQEIKISEEGIIFSRLPGEWHYLNEKNEVLRKIMADDLIPVSKKKQIIKGGGKYGLIDEYQRVLIPIEWDSLVEIKEDFFLAKQKGKWGAMQSTNQVIVSLAFDSLSFINGGFRAYQKNNGWQLLDSNGTAQTQKKYSYLNQFNGTTWIIKNGMYWGLLNAKGEEIVHCVFDSIGDRRASLLAVKFKGYYGIIDQHENWRLAPQSYPIRLANDSRYLVCQPGNSFLKSFDGQIIYFSSYPIQFKDEYWIEFLPDGRTNTISYDGLPVTIEAATLKSDDVFIDKKTFALNEGLRGIWKDGKYGFVDEQGQLRIANRYDSIGDFQAGLAPIKLIGKWGFINSSDKIIIQPNYETATSFVDGLSVVKRNRKMGVIDTNGKYILPLRYDQIKRSSNGKLVLSIGKLKGIANQKGIIEIEPRFDVLEDLNNGFLIVSHSSKWGLINSIGEDKIPMAYDKLVFDPTKNQYLAFRKSEWKKVVISE